VIASAAGHTSVVSRSIDPSPLSEATITELHQLLDEHIALGNMQRENEPMAIWTRPTDTVRGQPAPVRRYAYVPAEFERRAGAMGLVVPRLPGTRKRDIRRPGRR
jgi:hypothetical protein